MCVHGCGEGRETLALFLVELRDRVLEARDRNEVVCEVDAPVDSFAMKAWISSASTGANAIAASRSTGYWGTRAPLPETPSATHWLQATSRHCSWIVLDIFKLHARLLSRPRSSDSKPSPVAWVRAHAAAETSAPASRTATTSMSSVGRTMKPRSASAPPPIATTENDSPRSDRTSPSAARAAFRCECSYILRSLSAQNAKIKRSYHAAHPLNSLVSSS